MPDITIDSLKTEVAALAARIAAFEAATQPRPIIFPPTIGKPQFNAGEVYIGIIVSGDGERAYHLFLLPHEHTGDSWEGATEWAKLLGGELPDRVESALLYAHAKGQFTPEFYWTSEQNTYDANYVWCQGFDGGSQYGHRSDSRLRARAVRRLPI